VTGFAFGAIGFVALGAALLVVTSRNVVRAALWLVVTMAALAAEYVLLAAPFVAWVQVLIYIGAIVVLMLFAVMLTQAPTGASRELDSPNKPAAAVVAIACLGALSAVLLQAFRDSKLDLDAATKSGAHVTGEVLFRAYTLPFELISLLLLAALVGAIVLSRRDVGDEVASA
jgi:NADH-quinone oxidoreductase subunit J